MCAQACSKHTYHGKRCTSGYCFPTGVHCYCKTFINYHEGHCDNIKLSVEDVEIQMKKLRLGLYL